MCAGWGQAQGFSVDIRRAEAFNTLVFGEIGYSITTRFIKASTFHPRVFKGNPWCEWALFLVAQQPSAFSDAVSSACACVRCSTQQTHLQLMLFNGMLPGCGADPLLSSPVLRCAVPSLLRRCWVSIAVTAALQVMLTYIPGLNW